jgi:hypothetical protein
MAFDIVEVDGVPPINNRFPVDIMATPHEIGGDQHIGKIRLDQLPAEVMLISTHSSDPHTMIIDGFDVSVMGSKLETIEVGAEVNNLTDPQANSLTSGAHSAWHHHDDYYYRKNNFFMPGESQVNWLNLFNVPTEFNPSAHDHDDLYYRQEDIDALISQYYTKSDLDGGQLDNRYFTENEITTNYYSKVELDGGQLDNRYYTETEIDGIVGDYYSKSDLNAGQLNNLYYTEDEIDAIFGEYYTKVELDGGQLDNRYYTENEVDSLITAATYGISGSVQYYSNLPTLGHDSGIIYIVQENEGINEEGFYQWDGSSWTFLANNTGTSTHNDLSGLNDGDYKHLTSTEYTGLTGGTSTDLHHHDSRYFTESEITTNYYSKSQLDGGQLDNRYFTESEITSSYYSKTELNAGQLNNLYPTIIQFNQLSNNISTNYYTKNDLNSGQLDNRYFTESEITTNYYTKSDLNNGQLDNRYYTELEVDSLISASAFGISGSVQTYDDLPASENTGTIYIVKQTSGLNEEGFYRWDGSQWLFLANNTGTSTHNDLSGLNDGDYKHLTSVQFIGLTGGNDTSLHKHDDRYYTETEIDSTFSNYYTKSQLDSGQLDDRYYTEVEVNSLFGGYYTKAELDSGQLDNRYFTEFEITTNYYTKLNLLNPGESQIDWDNIVNAPDDFAPSDHNHDDLYYRRTDIDAFFNNVYSSYYTKTDLDGGQLDNRYYTETEINSLLGDYYTVAQLNGGQLDNRYFTESEITTNYYDKTDIDGLIAGAAFGIVGAVPTYADLPAGNDVGEIYIVQTTVGPNEEGFYRWDGSWAFLANNTGVSVIDHGSLTGLGDNDHPQYALKAGNETITGNWTFNNITIPNGTSNPSPTQTGEIFWNSNTNEFLIWDGSSWVSISHTGNSVSTDEVNIDVDHVVVGAGGKSIKDSPVTIDSSGSVEGVDYLRISRSGDTWMRLDRGNDVDQGMVMVYKYENYATTMVLSDLDDGPKIRLQQVGNGSESNAQYTSEIYQDDRTENIVFSTNNSPRFEIESNGTLHTRVSNYENLVTNDDDIPNKKYVDDRVVSDHGLLSGLDDDDHPQYLNITRHNAISNNPHSVTISQAIAADSATDITTSELEQLTNGSNITLHNHDGRYFTQTYISTNYYNKTQLNNGQLDNRYYTETEVDAKLAQKSDVTHVHDDLYYRKEDIDALASQYSMVGHVHDDRYYQKVEVDGLLAGKADVVHNHDDLYYRKSQIQSNSGTSGAKLVGVSFIGGLSSDNVQDAIEELYTEIESSANTLDEAYDQGRTITADAGPVVINSTTQAPLQVSNLSSAPTQNLSGGQMAIINNELYVFNVDKNKWLTPTKSLGFGRNGSADGNLLMAPGGVRNESSGFRMAKNGTIVGAALHSTSSVNNKDVDIRINEQVVYTVTTDNNGQVLDNTLNIDFSAGDVISVKVSSSGPPLRNATLVFEYGWRA